MILLDRTCETTLTKVLEKYGYDIQKDIAIEEMAELIKEIIKEKRGYENFEMLKEEIADVYIMILQLIIIYDPKQIEQVILTKLKLLEEKTEA